MVNYVYLLDHITIHQKKKKKKKKKKKQVINRKVSEKESSVSGVLWLISNDSSAPSAGEGAKQW